MLLPNEVVEKADTQLLNSNFKQQLEQPNHNEIICLSNQFYQIIEFPNMAITYTSKHISEVLGFTQKELSLIDLFNLVHPDDYSYVFFNLKRSLQIAIKNKHALYPYKCFMILNYRIKNKNNSFVKILNQFCSIDPKVSLKKFRILSLYTDLTLNNNTKFSTIENQRSKLRETKENKLSSLSHREQDVLSLLIKGRSSAEIGKTLSISKHTVDTHRRNMLIKSNLQIR